MNTRTPIAAFALLLVGCASDGVTLPPLPIWQNTDGSKPIMATDVAIEVRKLVPNATIHFQDASYILVSKEWLDDYLVWTWDAAKRAGLEYTPESFDCDDFSVLFTTLASRAAAKAEVKSAPLMARLVVGLPDGKRHELVGVATDKGIFIVEPQPDAGPFRITPLSKYPNPIQSVTFGD